MLKSQNYPLPLPPLPPRPPGRALGSDRPQLPAPPAREESILGRQSDIQQEAQDDRIYRAQQGDRGRNGLESGEGQHDAYDSALQGGDGDLFQESDQLDVKEEEETDSEDGEQEAPEQLGRSRDDPDNTGQEDEKSDRYGGSMDHEDNSEQTSLSSHLQHRIEHSAGDDAIKTTDQARIGLFLRPFEHTHASTSDEPRKKHPQLIENKVANKVHLEEELVAELRKRQELLIAEAETNSEKLADAESELESARRKIRDFEESQKSLRKQHRKELETFKLTAANQQAELEAQLTTARTSLKRYLRLPLELLSLVGQYALGDDNYATLANFSLTSRLLRQELLPMLYETVVLNKQDSLLSAIVSGNDLARKPFTFTKYAV